jgi:hypothetical protein
LQIADFERIPLFLLPDSKYELGFPKPSGLKGAVAQLVEQRTENPCVAGSIPAHTTKTLTEMLGFFVFMNLMDD